MGIANFHVDSDGRFVPSPRYGRRAAHRSATTQQAFARFGWARRGYRTARHRCTVEKAAALHRKVRRQRLDHAHKTALDLVRKHDAIAHEDLKIRNMAKAPAYRPDPRNRRAASCPTGPPRRTDSTARIRMPDGGFSRSLRTRLKAPTGK
ncbi:transposase [Streptomyces sp. NPDC008121]|uniref:transposase n=1 Tax=Streptomyces sp. NPDC008121 TaxID=3364809 RepID=UPI0036E5AF0C